MDIFSSVIPHTCCNNHIEDITAHTEAVIAHVEDVTAHIEDTISYSEVATAHLEVVIDHAAHAKSNRFLQQPPQRMQ